MKNMKKLFFVLTLLTLVLAITTVSAVDNDTTDVVSQAHTIVQDANNNVISTEQVQSSSDEIKVNTENKNIEQNLLTNHIIKNENDFNDLFNCPDSNDTYYLKDTVSNGDTITFETDISKITDSYVVNKSLNILGNNYTLDFDLIIDGCYNNISNSRINNLVVNGNYNKISYNTVNDQVIVSGNNNYITNNMLADDLWDEGNDNIVSPNTIIDDDTIPPMPQSSNKNLKSDDEPSILEITNANLESYGKTRPSGYQFSGSKIRPYDIICFTENMTDKTIILGVNDEKKIFTAKPGVVFTNSYFYIAGGMNKVLENITFDLNLLDSGEHTYFLVNGENDTFRNLKITYEEPSTSTSYLIKVQTQPNFVMDNCTVESTVIADLVDWGHNTGHPDLPSVIPFYIVGNNNVIINNNLSTEAYHTPSGDYPSLYNMYIQGNNNTVTNNTISVTGQRWMYNVILGYSSNNNVIKDNNINTKSINYSAGIYLTGTNICDNIIEGNTINTTAGYDKERDETIGSPEYVSYGIVVENRGYYGGFHYYGEGNVVKNDIINNTFIGSSYNIYALEIFGADGSLVENNTVNISGNTTMGLGAIGCNNTFNNNTITLFGERESGSTVDYLGAGTTGVLILRSDNSTATNNTINSTFYGTTVYLSTDSLVDGNNITSDFDYTINIKDSTNTHITNNYLIAKELKGDESVKDIDSTGTLIENNLPVEPKTALKVDTTEFTIGTNATIKASIYLNDDVATDITKGKVIFKVNGKTLKDENGKVIYAKVVNGVATIENYLVPDTWNKDALMIEAVYSGSTQCDAVRSEKTPITINKEEPIITTEDITTTVGGTINLTATITDGNKVINTGKVVFKVNGKSVKDANGKVIYAQIKDNKVNYEYTLPETYKAKNYTITATLISPDYNRLTDEKTLIVSNA